ncbi:hypothetical protein ACFL4G_06975 [Thermodesulfobacteriota bacterium]
MSSAKDEKRSGSDRRKNGDRRSLSASDYKGPEKRQRGDRRASRDRRKRG